MGIFEKKQRSRLHKIIEKIKRSKIERKTLCQNLSVFEIVIQKKLRYFFRPKNQSQKRIKNCSPLENDQFQVEFILNGLFQ